MKRYFGMVLSFFILFSASALACKMTPMGSDGSVIKAIVNQVQAQASESDREIKTIRKVRVKSSSWAYVVETTKAGKACQAIGYQALFQPSCQIKLEKMNARFQCGG